MAEDEIVVAEVVDEQPPRLPAGDLSHRHLGMLVSVQAGTATYQGRLKEVEHGRAIFAGAARVKLWLDLGSGGFLHPYVAPEATVTIIEEADRG